MKTKLFVAALVFIGATACAPRYTCPAYSIKKGNEVKSERIVQVPM